MTGLLGGGSHPAVDSDGRYRLCSHSCDLGPTPKCSGVYLLNRAIASPLRGASGYPEWRRL